MSARVTRRPASMTRSAAIARSTTAVFAAATLYIGVSGAALGQLRSEMRDPVRGISFHSIEISSEAMNDLDLIRGSFGDTDELAVGLSAMAFDGVPEIDSWIFWVRHEGRRWLDYDRVTPVSLMADGEPLELEPLRSPQPFVGEGGRMHEKLEFHIAAPEMSRLLAAESAVVSLRSDNGDVDKSFASEELNRIREFLASVKERTAANRRGEY